MPRHLFRRPYRPSKNKRTITFQPRIEQLESRLVPDATLTHLYNLNGNLTDALGGPALSAAGGTFTATRYDFDAGQGLQLSGGLSDTSSYSVVLLGNLSSGSSFYDKVIDFQALTSDDGLYLAGSKFQLFPDGVSGSNTVTANTDFQLILARDGATGTTRIYLNGVLDATYTGAGSAAAIPLANVLTFFEDDTTSGGMEAAPGSVDYIAIYDGALTATQVAGVFADPPTVVAPPTVSATATATTATEGQMASNSGSWTNAVSLSASLGTVVQNAGGTWNWSFNATEEQSQTVTITATSATGQVATTTFQLSVADAALSAAGQPVQGVAGLPTTALVATFVDLGGAEPNPSDDPGGLISSHYTAQIDWGDNTPSTPAIIAFTGAPGSTTDAFTVSGSHVYQTEGTFTVNVSIVHENGVTANVSTTATIWANIGILLLDPTDQGALFDTGNGTVTVTGASGAIVVDSSNREAALAAGNALVSAAELDVAGNPGAEAVGNASFNVPELNSAQPPSADPLASLTAPLPSGPIFTATTIHGGNVNLMPGTYVGGIQIDGQANVTLLPGVYFLEGGGLAVTGNAKVTGQNVLIYNSSAPASDAAMGNEAAAAQVGPIRVSGSASVTLSAPATGALHGIAIWQDRASDAAIAITGQGSLTVVGAVYAASAPVRVSGQGALTLRGDASGPVGARLIVSQLEVGGKGAVSVDTASNNLDVLPPGAAHTLGELDQQHGFHFAGSFFLNFYGFGEKWFQDRTGHWLALLPSGYLVPWNGASLAASARNPMANVGVQVFHDPILLFNAGVNLGVDLANTLAQLRVQFGFQFVGTYLMNSEGFGEKWFKDRLGNWFALTPDGSLVRWDGKSFASSARSVVASLGAVVFANPTLLFDAQVSPSAAALAQLGQLRDQYGFQFAGTYLKNSEGFGEKWFKDRLGSWFALTPAGSLVRWDGKSFTSSARTVVATLSPLVFDDPDLLFGAQVNLSPDALAAAAQLQD